MRAAAAIGAVVLIAATPIIVPTATSDPGVQRDEPRAGVAFVRTVSDPTPFTDDCGGEGEVFVDAEVEPHLSVNPRHPNHLMAVWQQDRYRGGGARSNVTAVSYDGGRSWRTSTLPGVSSCTGGERRIASDPWTAIGADGTAYVSSFAITGPPSVNDVGEEYDGDTVLSRSRNGGVTWESASPVAEDDGTFLHEKAAIVADPQAPETLYAVWGRNLIPDPTPILTTLDIDVAFARSDDRGRTWSEPVVLPPGSDESASEEPHQGLPGIAEWPHGGLLALPPEDGEGATRLVVVAAAAGHRIGDVPGCLLYSTTSTDGGTTWSTPSPIAAVVQEPPAADYEVIPIFRPVRGYTQCYLTSAAAAPDGSVYVAWFERTPVGDGPGGTEVRFARSDDSGTTWTTGVVAKSSRLAFLPTVAVAGDGTVGVTYFDTADDEFGDDEFTTSLRFASSTDRGHTWEDIDVAGPFDLRRAPDAGGYMLGDYDGLVGLPDGFGALVTLAEPIAETGRTDVFYVRIILDGR